MPDDFLPQQSIAAAALEYVPDGARIGLGSGRAAHAFVRALAQRVADGLSVVGAPTSQSTADLAASLGVPLAPLDDALPLDATIDGADEVDPRLNLIKGLGGALVREKIVAAASRRLVILVGPAEETPLKCVAQLGQRGRLPIEVIPFAVRFVLWRLAALGVTGQVRSGDRGPVLSDNGNYLVDLDISPLDDPLEFERQLLDIPGVIDTGLFLGLADVVLIQEADGVRVRRRE